jgi:hypothetical protein
VSALGRLKERIAPLKPNQQRTVWYFACKDVWANPRDGYGWDCWICYQHEDSLPSIDEAKRKAEGHAPRHHGMTVERDEGDSPCTARTVAPTSPPPE